MKSIVRAYRKTAQLSGFFTLAMALVFTAPALSAARAAEPLASVPYRIDYDGLLTIEVSVNGQGPYDFVIDTGSTITLAFANLALTQNFQPTNEPPKRIFGITGNRSFPSFLLGDIEIAGVTLPDHVGIVLDDFKPPRETPHGLIGLDFLREYAVYFDDKNRIMTIYNHGELPPEKIKKFARITMTPRNYGATSGDLFTVGSRINDKFTMLIVDLGAAGTLINYEASRALFAGVVGRSAGEGFSTGSRLKDIFDDRTRARTARVNRIKVGKKISWRQKGVWVYDAPVFEEIGVQHRPYGLFGVDLMRDRNFALDFGEQEMMIGPER